MKRIALLTVFLLLLVGTASADPFSEWEAYGDGWIATNDTYTIVKWNQTGEHTWITTGNASTLDYLVVGGAGGGGGGGGPGGGGGAGGMLTGTTEIEGSSIVVTVGDGGNGATGSPYKGTSGSNSSIGGSIIAVGGGGAGGYFTSALPGGSGGGSGGGGTNPHVGGAGTAGQGHDGGDAVLNDVSPYPSGGGGGAGQDGFSISGSQSGAGGDGLSNSITGTAIDYAGGGGGTSTLQGAIYDHGGSGGGGDGAYPYNAAGTAGTNGLGGGGGGSQTGAGGKGGSGVVIIGYSLISPVASFNLTLTDTSTGVPTSWQWNATNLLGNNTPVTISTDQNPILTLSQGNWLIDMIATNDIGSGTCNSTIGINLTSPQVYFWSRIS